MKWPELSPALRAKSANVAEFEARNRELLKRVEPRGEYSDLVDFLKGLVRC
jgi:hypothetical protein